MNDKEFRQHFAELLARQRNPDQPARKNPPTPEPTPKPATMSNKEFRQHLKQLMACERNEDQAARGKETAKTRTLEVTSRGATRTKAARHCEQYQDL